jgi:phage terminase large subunit-like protein
MDEYRWVQEGLAFCNAVITRERPACRFVIAACERFQRDLERQGTEAFPYEFDIDEAARWLAHLARLKHVKGPLAGRFFEPSGWQCFCTLNLYGWLRAGDAGKRRRFTEAYIECPRGQGKSFWVAGLGLGHLTIDGEIGAEVYCGATSEKQAWEVFRPARGMCLNNPEFCAEYGIDVHPKSRALYVLSTGARFEPLIGTPGDGAAPSFAIVDEYHEHSDSDQVDTMTTGMQKRGRPLLFVITTAGTDFGGPCREKRQDCVKILEQTVVDETVFAIIFTIDEPDGDRPGDPWDTVAALEKAQPGWFEHVNRDFVLSELEKAKRNPGKQASYRTKYLDQWVGAKSAWMNMLKFQACGRKSLTLEELLENRAAGWRLFIGLDLASKIDLASLAALFVTGSGASARYRLHVDRWVPEAQLIDGKNKERYVKWRDAGLINVTEGDIIDFDEIEERILWYRGRADIVEVGYDPFQATQLATHMLAEGVPMVEVPMTVRQISAPMKELEAVIYDNRFEYLSADEALVWQTGNVVAKRDKKANIFPDKEREEAKIDDVVAELIAMNRVIGQTAQAQSFWETA